MKKNLILILIALTLSLGSHSVWAVSESTPASKAKSEILNRAAEIATQSAQLASGQYIGTIEKIGKQTISLKTDIDTRTIVVDSETKFVQSPRKAFLKITDLEAGDNIIALGSIDPNNVLTARVIIIKPTTASIPSQVTYGIIESMDQTKKIITLKNPRTSLISTIAVNRLTELKIGRAKNPIFSDLKTGSQMAATGAVDKNGLIQTNIILAIPPEATPSSQPTSTPSSKTSPVIK